MTSEGRGQHLLLGLWAAAVTERHQCPTWEDARQGPRPPSNLGTRRLLATATEAATVASVAKTKRVRVEARRSRGISANGIESRGCLGQVASPFSSSSASPGKAKLLFCSLLLSNHPKASVCDSNTSRLCLFYIKKGRR